MFDVPAPHSVSKVDKFKEKTAIVDHEKDQNMVRLSAIFHFKQMLRDFRTPWTRLTQKFG